MAKLCCQADDKANKVCFSLLFPPLGYVSHVNGLSIDNNNNNNETSAMPAAATLYLCLCVCVVVPFLFVSCIIVIKILQFLAQFRALSPPPPPPPRCHLTLTTVQLPYQRQPPPLTSQQTRKCCAINKEHNTLCESKERERERERAQQERAPKSEGGTKR